MAGDPRIFFARREMAPGSGDIKFRKFPEHFGGKLVKIGAVFVPAILAGLIYGMLALAFKVPAAKEMLEFVFARFKK